MSYEIETGIPAPAAKTRTKYPFAEMGVGDSFFVPAADASQKQIGSAAYCWARQHENGRKFATKAYKEPPGTRCWRTV